MKLGNPIKRRRGRAYSMLIISYIALLILTMCFASVSYSRLYNTSRRHAQQQVTHQLEQAAYIVDSYVESIQQSMLSLSLNTHVNSFIYTKPPLNTDDYYRVVQVISEIGSQFTNNSCLQYLFIYQSSQDCIVTNSTRLSTRDFYQLLLPLSDVSYDEWLHFLNTRNYFSAFPVQTHSANGSKLVPFSLSIPISNATRGAVIGYMNVSQIEKVFFSSSLLNKGVLQVMDHSGKIIATLGETAFTEQKSDDQFTVSVSGETCFDYICTLPESVYLDALSPTRTFIILMFIFELLGMTLFSIALSHMNYSPLQRLLVQLNHIPAFSKDVKNEYELILHATDKVLKENSSLTQRLLAQQPLLKSSLIHRLLDGSTETDSIHFEDFDIDLSKAPYTVLLLHVSQHISEGASPILNYSLMNVWERYFENKAVCYALEYTYNTLALLLCEHEHNPDQLLSESVSYLQSKLKCSLIVGVGKPAKTISEIGISCRQAQEALDYATAWRKYGITFYDDLPPSRGLYTLLPAHEQELTRLLREGDGSRVRTLIQTLFLHARSEPLLHIRVIVFNIVTICLRLLDEWKIDSPIRDMIDHIYLHLSDDALPEQLCESICTITDELCELANQLHTTDALQLSKTVQTMINARFSDPAFSLTQVADELHFNASYVSHVFKQQTGNNFIDALNDRRLMHACLLLRTTMMTVQSIAEECGYSSAGYLNRVFKKKYDQTPGQYRSCSLKNDVE